MSWTKDYIISMTYVVELGIEVFGSDESFGRWQMIESEFFDGCKPHDYMHTLAGLMAVKEHLENLAHGDLS